MSELETNSKNKNVRRELYSGVSLRKFTNLEVPWWKMIMVIYLQMRTVF